MTVCVIKVCRNYRGRVKATKHVTYHRIPLDPIIRNRWIDCIRKSRGEPTWKPAKTTVVCSDHFRSKEICTVNKSGRKRLTEGAVPSKALFLSSVKPSESEDSGDIEIVEKSNSNEAELSDVYSDVCSSTESVIFVIKDIEIEPDSNADEIISDQTVDVQNKIKTEVEESFSDLDSIFDTPKEVKLRYDLRRKIKLEKKHRLKIQSLRRKNLRLKKRIASFKKNIDMLKKERYIDNDIYNILKSNAFASDFHSNMKKKLKGCAKIPTKHAP